MSVQIYWSTFFLIFVCSSISSSENFAGYLQVSKSNAWGNIYLLSTGTFLDFEYIILFSRNGVNCFACILTIFQVGTYGSLEQHGFARNRIWAVEKNPPPLHPNDSIGKSFVDLLLKPGEEDQKCWPHG